MKLLLTLAALLLLAAPARAATYYVDQGHAACSDAGPGTETEPWCRLETAMARLVAGDTALVKDGTYHGTGTGPSILTPVFQPAKSGTASAPIAIRAYTPPSGPRHQPMLSMDIDLAVERRVVFGSWGRNHVIWDGFRTVPHAEARLQACTGCVIENSVIAPGPTSWRNGRYGLFQAIFLQRCVDCEIRHNRLSDVYWNDHEGDANASLTKSYMCTRLRISHNEFRNATVGIYDKTSGVENVYEYNRFENMRAAGWGAVAFANVYDGRVEGNVVRHNLIINAPFGVYFNRIRNKGTGNVVSDNTLVNVRSPVHVEGYTASPDHLQVGNNPVVRRPRRRRTVSTPRARLAAAARTTVRSIRDLGRRAA